MPFFVLSFIVGQFGLSFEFGVQAGDTIAPTEVLAFDGAVQVFLPFSVPIYGQTLFFPELTVSLKLHISLNCF